MFRGVVFGCAVLDIRVILVEGLSGVSAGVVIFVGLKTLEGLLKSLGKLRLIELIGLDIY